MDLQYTGPSAIVKLYHIFIEIVFPKSCLNCGEPHIWFCQNCEANCLLIQSPTCPFCDRLSPLGKTCSRCQKRYKLNGLRSIWYYKDPAVTIIKKIKYRHQFAAIEQLLPHLFTLYRELPISPTQSVMFTSVPSHGPRINQYGYNQSELLAQILARATKQPYRQLLRRRFDQPSQTKLGRQDRFSAATKQYYGNKIIPDKTTVIIVDDVATTGATLATCAQKLKENGAKSVWAITIAKD